MNVSPQFYEFILIESSVIPDPDFSHPGSQVQQKQEEKGKHFFVLPLFVAINFTKLKVILLLNRFGKQV
jgi:hypothetical protein